jgi:hypothetical protein
MYFRKYEFNSIEEFNTLMLTVPETSIQTIVYLGVLSPNKFSVDILWENEIPVDWTEFEIWDVEGNGHHTFLGWEFKKQ